MKRYFISLLAVMFSFALSAAKYTLKQGVNYMTSFQSADCTFTPDQDGKVLIEAQEIYTVTYDGKTFNQQYTPGANYPYVYEVADVKAGTDVKVYSDFVWNNKSVIKVTLYAAGQNVPVELVNVSPKPGSVFDWNNSGMVSLNFNKNVTFSSIKFIVGDYVADVDDIHTGSSIGFNITNALNTALKNGVLTPGERFYIRFWGLRDANDDKNLYNVTGDLMMPFIAPAAQYGFTKATVGESQLSYFEANAYKFLSYYSKDAEDGLFTFEFEGNIGNVSSVTMTMGSLDLAGQGKYHRSNLPYTIEGNKLLVDARGTLRTLAVLFPAVVEEEGGEEGGESIAGDFDKEHVTISLTNVLDENGNAFLSGLPGSVGSFSFVMGYEELVDEAYLDGDNVADGDDVYAGQEISLWLSNANIKFDGLQLTYFVSVDNSNEEAQILEPRTLVISDYTVTEDPFEGVVITFRIPQMPNVVMGSTVRVALNNANSADGMPHYLYIEFKAADVPDCIRGLAAQTPADGKVYRIDGTRAAAGQCKGVVVKDGRKIVVK